MRPFSFARRPAVPWVHHYPFNERGRDFVVGDLHGCVLTLLRALDALGFHPYLDRLFSVGDLVDRGAHSLETLKLLDRPWFRAVLGNHEELLIRHLERPRSVAPHEDEWLNEEAPRLIDRMAFADAWLPTLLGLPRVIVVGTGTQRYNVVHAELLTRGGPVTDAMIDRWTFPDAIKAQERALWGRTLIKAHRRGRPLGHAHDPVRLSTTYCGHSIVSGPVRLGNQVFLDQGAFLGFTQTCPEDGVREDGHEPGLVLAEPKTGRFWLAPSDPLDSRTVRPIELHRTVCR